MYSPESGGDESDVSSSFPNKSPESQNNESGSEPSPPNNQSDYQKKDIPPPTIEQTPTRFLASCSKLDLEPNPFEQSFSGVNPLTNEVGTNSPKPSLPPVSQIASPGVPASEEQYGWSLQSLRSGALSPSMLTGPQDTTLFNDLSQPGRTGTTPLPFASFSDHFNGANNFVNQPLSVLPNDPFVRNTYNQSVPRSLSDSDRKSIPSNPTTSAPPVNNVSTSQSGVIQPGLPSTNILNISNGSSTSTSNVIVQNPLNQSVLVTNSTLNNRNMVCAPQQDLISRNTIISDTIMTKTENDDFTSHSNNVITNLPNGRHSNTINSTIPSRKSSIMSVDSMDDELSNKLGSSSSMKSSPRNSRRKAEESLVKEQPPSKKNGQKVKNEMTDEEKRRNFLERNRQAALKCRQRKKQWLANLQAKVEYLTNDNENLQNQAQSLREEIINLKTLLLAHKDCPIAQANGVMGLDSIPPTSQGIPPSMNGMNLGSMGMVPGGIPNPAMTAGVPVNGVQGSMPISNVQVPPHMTNHVNGPPGSGLMRY
ncbi:19453_t:CDS:2 [Gigaspora margarita]|uniref:19453_t:CDS:1 n=1 Tax=Gigaspora margarita TaxID=4874 RepID=A0ABM8W506_GIGMA|nr:19453_t:CDS:2 [Gigaspora margarita]